MIGKLRLGYPDGNTTVEWQTNRTCRMNDRHPEQVVPMAVDLTRQNIADLANIIEWNEKHGLRFFRISSEIMPQISNWRLINDKLDFRELAYDIEQFAPAIARAGELARQWGHRLTFHPGFFTVLNTSNRFMLISVMRELWWHTRFLELAGMGADSTLTLHVGGVNDDKPAAIRQFVKNFNQLPANIKWRIIIENDETKFNADDLIEISAQIKPYEFNGATYHRVPICFDYFHYCVYNRNRAAHPTRFSAVRPVEQLLPEIRATWEHGRRQKMHLSEQLDYANMGAHSYYIERIPRCLLDLNIDLMIEAKAKEQAVFWLLERF